MKRSRRLHKDHGSAFEILDSPPAMRPEREVERISALLDEIADERPPLEVEMLVSREGRRESNGRAKQ